MLKGKQIPMYYKSDNITRTYLLQEIFFFNKLMSKYGIFTEENDSEYYFQIVKPSNGEKKEIITIEKLDMRYPPNSKLKAY